MTVPRFAPKWAKFSYTAKVRHDLGSPLVFRSVVEAERKIDATGFRAKQHEGHITTGSLDLILPDTSVGAAQSDYSGQGIGATASSAFIAQSSFRSRARLLKAGKYARQSMSRLPVAKFDIDSICVSEQDGS